MQVVLNEYTLALLCGGISCLTYFLTTTLAPATGKTVRIQDDSKRKNRKPILKSTNSEANDSVDDEEDDDDEADADEQVCVYEVLLKIDVNTLAKKGQTLSRCEWYKTFFCYCASAN